MVWAMQTCEEARNSGGYVASETKSEDEPPMHALVELPELQARLDCAALMDHTIWKTCHVPPAELAEWKSHREMSGFMYRVLAFSLVRMPAYADLKLELPDGLGPDWRLIREWLSSKLPSELTAAWQTHWAAPMLEDEERRLAHACGRIKALLAECTSGRPASVDRKTVDDILAALPDFHPTKCFLTLFFSAVIAYANALGAGSLATATQVSFAKTKLQEVVKAWPEAPPPKQGAA